jgi:hypothetical protein
MSYLFAKEIAELKVVDGKGLCQLCLQLVEPGGLLGRAEF